MSEIEDKLREDLRYRFGEEASALPVNVKGAVPELWTQLAARVPAVISSLNLLRPS